MPVYRARIIVTEEAIRQFWPKGAGAGFIESAEWTSGKLNLEWGSWSAGKTNTSIPWDELKQQLPPGLPEPKLAGNLPERDSICLVFREDEPGDFLKLRLQNGDIHEIGILMSSGFQ